MTADFLTPGRIRATAISVVSSRGSAWTVYTDARSYKSIALDFRSVWLTASVAVMF